MIGATPPAGGAAPHLGQIRPPGRSPGPPSVVLSPDLSRLQRVGGGRAGSERYCWGTN